MEWEVLYEGKAIMHDSEGFIRALKIHQPVRVHTLNIELPVIIPFGYGSRWVN